MRTGWVMVFEEKGPARGISDDGNYILALMREGQLTRGQAWWWLEEEDKNALTIEITRLASSYSDPEERLAVFWGIHGSARNEKR